MDPMAIFREFAQAAAPAAVTALWQGLVLAAGLAICLRFAPRVAASDRFRAWAAGFVALVALPFLPLLNAIHLGASSADVSSAAAPMTRAWLDVDPRWALAIAGIWIAASVWRAGDLVVHSLRLRKVWKNAEPIEFAGAQVEVCATRELDRPSVIGFFRPRVLIPAWLLNRLTTAELDQVVLHEAEHLRRCDDWTNLLQKLALVVFPLNPSLAWMERQLCLEREMACDDAVVRATGKPRAYAACLANLAERGLERRREALSLGAWRKRPELVGRVHRLLKHAPGLNPVAARALLAVVGGGLVCGSVEFVRAPQLVAFVAPVVAQSTTPDLVNTDARAMAGFSAVNAVAHIPSRSEMTPVAESKHYLRSAIVKTNCNEGAPRNSIAGAGEPFEIAAQETTGPANDGQQWIVLTAWEQVVTNGPRSTIVADYDVIAPGESAERVATGAASGAATAIAPAAVREWTFTQLILRVDPARTAAGVAHDAITPDSSSQPAQPAAIPLRDGWLVLQL